MRIAVVLLSVFAVGGAYVTGSAAKQVAAGCRIDRGVLPAWARGGFSDPEPRAPHVLGRSGSIVAILFGNPLSSPPAAGRSNKILWVAKHSPRARAALWIRAQRLVAGRPTGAPVTRALAGGPGPSIVNLPEPGCWRLDLHWSGGSDVMTLRYRSP